MRLQQCREAEEQKARKYIAVGDDIMSSYVLHLCDIATCCICLKSDGHYLFYKFCFFLQMYWRLPVNAYVAF
ncbi:hypothetical protein COLO4_37625 [Corchorus olitorius]|uniref:Uncharacterized protein n=1 Tax=Corchorus olitorius TaxID=93759 RepID=A0A1R3G0G5_9ROSI|nr:hypothetical protein COLO4_37625 [Corchorus olitorius]